MMHRRSITRGAAIFVTSLRSSEGRSGGNPKKTPSGGGPKMARKTVRSEPAPTSHSSARSPYSIRRDRNPVKGRRWASFLPFSSVPPSGLTVGPEPLFLTKTSALNWKRPGPRVLSRSALFTGPPRRRRLFKTRVPTPDPRYSALFSSFLFHLSSAGSARIFTNAAFSPLN